MSALTPGFKHVFRLADGEVLEAFPPRGALRTMDRRGDRPPEVVWEITTPAGLVRRLWPEEIAEYEMVEL